MNKNEDNFESLRQLLALKRHEVPPPGYFHNFSGEVMSRIRAGEASERASGAQRLSNEAPWLIRFLELFEAKPAFAGAFASVMCMLLLFGIVIAERPDNVAQPLLTANDQPVSPLASLAPTAFAAQSPVQSGPTVVAMNSTNPVSLQPVATLFGGGQGSMLTPVSFSPGGN